jgi:hypothetical protein
LQGAKVIHGSGSFTSGSFTSGSFTSGPFKFVLRGKPMKRRVSQPRRLPGRPLVMLFLLCPFVLIVGSGRSLGNEPAAPPTFAAVEETVQRHFAKQKHYQPADIISQGDWDATAGELKKLGWTPADADKIRGRLLPDKSFLVVQTRTPAGRNFIRQVAQYPGAYDRLDHLSALPSGQQTVNRLIAGPDGYKLLQYMTTSPGGKELGNMLAADPGGKDFNRPTGRIYTSGLLIEQLKQSYSQSHGKPAGAKPGASKPGNRDPRVRRGSPGL